MNTEIPGLETPVGPSPAQVGDGPTVRPISAKRAWRHFVEKRRVELRDEYPCAAPTRRVICPKHHSRIGPNTGICKPCRDELYAQLAAEYIAASERQKGASSMSTTQADLLPEVIEQPPPAPLTLFGTADPRLALERMADLAKVLVDVVRDRKLAVRINGREHLTAEAWTTLGGMLGVVPVVEWSHPLGDGDGWEARVEARTLDGRVVGAAESMCTRTESAWGKRDDYALRSMAQTRAISRALRAPLGQIIVLAGYEAAPAEEMPAEEPKPRVSSAEPTEAKPQQLAEIGRLIKRLAELKPETDWKQRARELAGGPPNLMTVTIANALIDQLQRSVDVAEQYEGAAAESPTA